MADAAGSSRPGLATTLASAWRTLDRNQRLAGAGATVMVLSLMLPWFQQTGIQQVPDPKLPAGTPRTETVSIELNGFEAFSWIEAAVLLVGLGVLAMLFARGDRRPFHIPGGDGAVLAAAGGWSIFLIAYRVLFFKPTHIGLETGVEWGLLVAIAGAATIVAAGLRIHSAHRPEPPNPAAEAAAQDATAVQPRQSRPQQRAPSPPAPSGTQLRFGDVEPARRIESDSTPEAGAGPDGDAPAEQQLEIPIDDPGRRGGRRDR